MAAGISDSIIEYFGRDHGHSCGYCKSKNTNFAYGMWGHALKVSDYQDLIDRGWRRSGCYLYKPRLKIQCCPMYTIKNDTLNFKLSNSQKKVIKNFNRYINFDVRPKINDKCGTEEDEDSGIKIKDSPENVSKFKHTPKPGIGEDASKPKCKKAKLIRAEKKKEKIKINVMSGDGVTNTSKASSCVKSLEQHLNDGVENSRHRLRIELVRSGSENVKLLADTEHHVYQKYQTVVHGDKPKDVQADQFKRFLIDSALEKEDSAKQTEAHPGYGSFHQQYWIDDRLVAVGVIDILPRCVSSVYFFYDPEFSFLSLGTYAALREIEFVRKLQKIDEDLSSYYMGFYIHSCKKMRYKAQFQPSFLLCPETSTWHPIESCLPLLEANKYSRFAPPEAVDEEGKGDASGMLILHQGMVMKYSEYLRHGRRPPKHTSLEAGLAEEYTRLVGRRASERMLFYWK